MVEPCFSGVMIPTVNDPTDAPAGSPSDEPSAEGAPENGAESAPDDAIAKLTEQRDKFKDQLLRTAADFDNFRKRARRDVEDADRRGREETLRELLPVFDNLERAVSAAGSAADVKAVAEGVQMVLKLFEDVAGRVGLTRVDTIGKAFDPNQHDAVQQLETSEHPPGTIVTEIVPGYRYREKLLRPALVVVARPPTSA